MLAFKHAVMAGMGARWTHSDEIYGPAAQPQWAKRERCVCGSSWSDLGRQSKAEVTICRRFALLSVPVGKLREMMEWKNKMSQHKGVNWTFKHFLIPFDSTGSKWISLQMNHLHINKKQVAAQTFSHGQKLISILPTISFFKCLRDF